MKKQSASILTQISTEQLQRLTTIVTETVATGFDQPKGKKFTTADLWNIQRQGKTRIQRRFIF
ncbi:MAG: hypothetical protein H7Z13_20485 [Ferruginibacter sp.]|nr:hypothetical protein [Ferruginibacter sp.]